MQLYGAAPLLLFLVTLIITRALATFTSLVSIGMAIPGLGYHAGTARLVVQTHDATLRSARPRLTVCSQVRLTGASFAQAVTRHGLS
jgi:hypothetical protein